MGVAKVTASVRLSMIVISLPELSITMLVPPAVSILVGDGTPRVLVLKTSFCASITFTLLVDVLESNTRFFKPVGLGVLLLVLEPQPAIASARPVTKNCER